MRETTLFNEGWEFCKCPIGTGYAMAQGWQPVEVPHDWLIWNSLDLYETSTGWYRHTLTVPKDGRRTYLRFDGVYMDCRVYVNGAQAGEWKYGYTTFEVDITDFLTGGEDLITVQVDHREPNSRWYSGAGIYRSVHLIRTGQSHILPDGVYVSARTDGTVLVTVEAQRPQDDTLDGYSLRTCIYPKDGSSRVPLAERRCACVGADPVSMSPAVVRQGWKYSVTHQTLKVQGPHLWDIKDPYLYICAAELIKDGAVIDMVVTDFGFRDAVFDPEKGFLLNGRRVKLHGACEHHDLGALGAAFNITAMERKLLTLREMGVNALRTSHNPPAPEVLDLTDRLGFLVIDEAFDMWEMKKTDYDYARFFKDWAERDVASWIRRDRDRPSVIAWSIGNEIYDTHASDRGMEIASELTHWVRTHDPRGNGWVTIGSNYMGSERARRCSDIFKVAGYNYAERLYAEHHAEHPDWCIYGSETSSVVQSRGIYHFPRELPILNDDDEQCSALGNTSPGWAAKNTEACIIPDRDTEFCAGQFIWTGFDYIGEPTPYSTKNSYFGQHDTAGFPKDSAYIFRAAWTDGAAKPFIHLYPHWDWNPGQLIDLRAATNCTRAAIFLNGEKVAESALDPLHGDTYTLDARIPYVPGELVAAAYDSTGKEVARDVQRSFGDTAKLLVKYDRTTLRADGKDMIFLTICAADENGTLVANANDLVTVRVSGAGRLVGLDNGDSTDYDQYKGISRRLFSGKLLAMIMASDRGGQINVSIQSQGLPEKRLTLTAEDAGLSPDPRRVFSQCEERPLWGGAGKFIRKIELSGEQYEFTPERRELTFNVRCLPADNDFADTLEYRITNVSGITTDQARVTAQTRDTVTVECLGDGEFYLRALTKNGTTKYKVISAIRLTAQGLGSAFMDPYTLMMGGLYTLGERATMGLEHGANIQSGGWFAFENVDFGALGSDTVTLPIFANYSTPVRISIYDGIPADGELLGDFEYDIPSIWMTYQEKTYRLNRILKGVHTISFYTDFGFDVKGAVFEPRTLERSEIFASENQALYGDKFTVEGTDVLGIGNNVMFDFGQVDFTETSPEAIVLTGRSALPKNSIHIIFTDEAGVQTRVLAEFEGAEDYTERAFPLPELRGKYKLEIVFLPGSDFDMRSFKFK